MRSRALKHGNKGGEMEIEKLNNKLKDQEQPHLSGAYIRSLVKQLSSSRTKNSPMNQKALDTIDGHGVTQKITRCSSDGLSENQKIHQPQQPEQPKKQVRRRLHTSRPYQERLLNMAEARREIVTALKFHRASMKQANEQQQQQQQLQSQSSLQPSPHPPLPQLFQEQEENRNSRRKYQTSTTTNTISCCYENPSYSPFSCPPPPSCSFPWGASSIEPIPFAENFNLPLPNQPLGLNLSFNDFNLDTTLYHYNNENPSIYSYSSQTSSSNHTLSSPEEEAHSIMVVPEEPQHHIMANGGGVHTAFGSYDMADIQSSGEQHQMEYNDTMNIVDSAWWVEFDSTMEKKEEKCDEDDEFHIFDEVMEFPAWMNDDENCLLDEHLENNCLDDGLQEPALPCMGIEEIDGMGGDWLA